MELFAILTVQTPVGNGYMSVTASGVVTTPARATRQDIFTHMREIICRENGERFATAEVVFFSAEPNTISA
jgi:hypothetical protein